MLIPFYYQKEAIDATIDFLFNTNKNGVLWIPTAGGKSLIQAEIAKRVYDIGPDYQMIFLTDVTALIGQNREELMNQWPGAKTSVFSASYGEKSHAGELVFCGIQSVYKHADLFEKVSVIFIDEVHRASLEETSMYKQFWNKIKKKNPHARLIGLSASPWKLSGPLKGTWICDEIIYKIEMSTLFKEGFLCPLVTPDTSMQADTDSIPVLSSGEFNETEMAKIMDDTNLIRSAMKDAMKHANDRKSGLIFACNIKHANHIKQIMRDEFGEHAEVIIGDTVTDERQEIIERFKRFELRWIISVGTLTTGFNAKNADLGIILRAMQSSSLWLQIIGRFLRVHESKSDAMILDYGRNIKRFGRIDKIGPPPSKEQREQAKRTPFKQCYNLECKKLIPYLAKECPHCHVTYEAEESSPNHGDTAETDDIMTAASMIKTIDIDRVEIRKHHSQRTKSKSLRVSYYRQAEVIHEYLFFEGKAFQRNEACSWWSKFAADEVSWQCPRTLDTAIAELKAYGIKEVKRLTVDYSEVQKTSALNLYGHKILDRHLD